jgi:hypothetical protein
MQSLLLRLFINLLYLFDYFFVSLRSSLGYSAKIYFIINRIIYLAYVILLF